MEATRRIELTEENKDLSGRFKYLIMEMTNAYPTTTGTGEVYRLGRANEGNANLL